MKKKILIIIQDGVGGAERVSVLIGKELDMKHFEVKFVLVSKGNNTSISDFIPDIYSIIRVPKGRPIKIMWRLLNIVKHEHPHVVFSSVLYLNNKILPFHFLFKSTRFVIRCENYLYTFNKKQHIIIRMLYQWADAIIVQTQEMADELKKENMGNNKIHVLQNPVDVKLIDKLLVDGNNPYPQNGKKHFVASGRFTYQKGFDLLIRAFRQVSRTNNECDLYIIGDKDYNNGEVYKDLMKYAENEGIGHLVHCVGYQKNPYVYIKYADCFVLSSRWEGLPNVLIEAQYLGTPSAAFKCIPIVERIVNNEENGFLAEKEDVSSLAMAMKRAMSMGRICCSYKSSSIEEFTKIVIGGGKIMNLRQLNYWVRMDYESYKMKHPYAARFTYGENWELFTYMRNLRYLEYYINKEKKHLWNKLLMSWYWIKHRRNCKVLGISITPNTVGPGFHLQHRGFRHLSSNTKIGANCEILPMVLAGTKRPEIEDPYVIVGNNCYIGTGVTLLGPIKIGNDVTIAAGAVVTKDVPDNCVIAGIPAKLIKKNESTINSNLRIVVKIDK